MDKGSKDTGDTTPRAEGSNSNSNNNRDGNAQGKGNGEEQQPKAEANGAYHHGGREEENWERQGQGMGTEIEERRNPSTITSGAAPPQFATNLLQNQYYEQQQQQYQQQYQQWGVPHAYGPGGAGIDSPGYGFYQGHGNYLPPQYHHPHNPEYSGKSEWDDIGQWGGGRSDARGMRRGGGMQMDNNNWISHDQQQVGYQNYHHQSDFQTPLGHGMSRRNATDEDTWLQPQHTFRPTTDYGVRDIDGTGELNHQNRYSPLSESRGRERGDEDYTNTSNIDSSYSKHRKEEESGYRNGRVGENIPPHDDKAGGVSHIQESSTGIRGEGGRKHPYQKHTKFEDEEFDDTRGKSAKTNLHPIGMAGGAAQIPAPQKLGRNAGESSKTTKSAEKPPTSIPPSGWTGSTDQEELEEAREQASTPRVSNGGDAQPLDGYENQGKGTKPEQANLESQNWASRAAGGAAQIPLGPNNATAAGVKGSTTTPAKSHGADNAAVGAQITPERNAARNQSPAGGTDNAAASEQPARKGPLLILHNTIRYRKPTAKMIGIAAKLLEKGEEVCWEDLDELPPIEATSLAISLAALTAYQSEDRPAAMTLAKIAATALYLRNSTLLQILWDPAEAQSLLNQTAAATVCGLETRQIYPDLATPLYNGKTLRRKTRGTLKDKDLRKMIVKFSRRMFDVDETVTAKMIEKMGEVTLRCMVSTEGILTTALKDNSPAYSPKSPFYFHQSDLNTTGAEIREDAGTGEVIGPSDDREAGRKTGKGKNTPTKNIISISRLPRYLNASSHVPKLPLPGNGDINRKNIRRMILESQYKVNGKVISSPFTKLTQVGVKGETQWDLEGTRFDQMRAAATTIMENLESIVHPQTAPNARIVYDEQQGKEQRQTGHRPEQHLLKPMTEMKLATKVLDRMNEEKKEQILRALFPPFVSKHFDEKMATKIMARIEEATLEELVELLKPHIFAKLQRDLGGPERRFKYGGLGHGSNQEYEMIISCKSDTDAGFNKPIIEILGDLLSRTHLMLKTNGHTFGILPTSEESPTRTSVGRDGRFPAKKELTKFITASGTSRGLDQFEFAVETSHTGLALGRDSMEGQIAGGDVGQWRNFLRDEHIMIHQRDRKPTGYVPLVMFVNSFPTDDDYRAKTELAQRLEASASDPIDPRHYRIGWTTIRADGERGVMKCILAKESNRHKLVPQLMAIPPITDSNYITTTMYRPVEVDFKTQIGIAGIVEGIREQRRCMEERTYAEITGIAKHIDLLALIPSESFLYGDEVMCNIKTVAQLLMEGTVLIGSKQVKSPVIKVTTGSQNGRWRVYAKKEDAGQLLEFLHQMVKYKFPAYLLLPGEKVTIVGLDKGPAEKEATNQREHPPSVDDGSPVGQPAPSMGAEANIPPASIPTWRPPPGRPPPGAMVLPAAARPPPQPDQEVQGPGLLSRQADQLQHRATEAAPSIWEQQVLTPPEVQHRQGDGDQTKDDSLEMVTEARRSLQQAVESQRVTIDNNINKIKQLEEELREKQREWDGRHGKEAREREEERRIHTDIIQAQQVTITMQSEKIKTLEDGGTQTTSMTTATPPIVAIDLRSELQSSISTASDRWKEEAMMQKREHAAAATLTRDRHAVEMKEMHLLQDQRMEAMSKQIGVAMDCYRYMMESYTSVMHNTGTHLQESSLGSKEIQVKLEYLCQSLKYGDVLEECIPDDDRRLPAMLRREREILDASVERLDNKIMEFIAKQDAAEEDYGPPPWAAAKEEKKATTLSETTAPLMAPGLLMQLDTEVLAVKSPLSHPTGVQTIDALARTTAASMATPAPTTKQTDDQTSATLDGGETEAGKMAYDQLGRTGVSPLHQAESTPAVDPIEGTGADGRLTGQGRENPIVPSQGRTEPTDQVRAIGGNLRAGSTDSATNEGGTQHPMSAIEKWSRSLNPIAVKAIAALRSDDSEDGEPQRKVHKPVVNITAGGAVDGLDPRELMHDPVALAAYKALQSDDSKEPNATTDKGRVEIKQAQSKPTEPAPPHENPIGDAKLGSIDTEEGIASSANMPKGLGNQGVAVGVESPEGAGARDAVSMSDHTEKAGQDAKSEPLTIDGSNSDSEESDSGDEGKGQCAECYSGGILYQCSATRCSNQLHTACFAQENPFLCKWCERRQALANRRHRSGSETSSDSEASDGSGEHSGSDSDNEGDEQEMDKPSSQPEMEFTIGSGSESRLKGPKRRILKARKPATKAEGQSPASPYYKTRKKAREKNERSNNG